MSNRWALILLLGGALTLFLGVKRMPTELPAYFASKRFVAVNATVVDFQETTKGSGRSAEKLQWLRFKYLVDGKEYEGDNKITRADDTRSSLESLINSDGNAADLTVYYDRENPTLVSVKHTIPIGSLLVFTVVGALLMALGGLVLLMRWRDREGA